MATMPKFTRHPRNNVRSVGDDATFSVAVAGNPAPRVTWYRDGRVIPGATGLTYVLNAVADTDDGAVIKAKARNSKGEVFSNEATLTVNAAPRPIAPPPPAVTAPTITTQPQATTVVVGQPATFNVVASGTGLTYEWRRNGNPLPDTNAATYTIPHAASTDAGQYSVKVSNLGGQVTSVPVALTVNPAPAAARPTMSKGAKWLLAILGIFLCIGIVLGTNALIKRNAPAPDPEETGCVFTTSSDGFAASIAPGTTKKGIITEDNTKVDVTCPAGGPEKFDADKHVVFVGCEKGYEEVSGEDRCELPATEAPEATEEPAGTAEPEATEEPAGNDTGNDGNSASAGDGHALAEEAWGESLPEVPELYSAHAGEEGYPDDCAGLCWDMSKADRGVMLWYGPNMGEEDITQSDADFGNGDMGPLESMRTGKVTKVIFYNGKEAQLEVCAIGSLDGTPLTEVLGVNEGECGKRVALSPGWHVIEDNANSPIAGFGVRLTASGWAGMTEGQIVEYTGYWEISGDTATWTGPNDVEIMMTPAMVSMMQDFGTLKNVVFTTSKPGRILLCNGYVDGDANLESPDGSCQLFDVPTGTFTYTGEDRLSAGVSWQPK